MSCLVPAEVPGRSKSPLITISVRLGSRATSRVTAVAPTVSVRTRPSVTGVSSASVAPCAITIEPAEKSVYVPGWEAYTAKVFAPLKVSVPTVWMVGMWPLQTIVAPDNSPSSLP